MFDTHRERDPIATYVDPDDDHSVCIEPVANSGRFYFDWVDSEPHAHAPAVPDRAHDDTTQFGVPKCYDCGEQFTPGKDGAGELFCSETCADAFRATLGI